MKSEQRVNASGTAIETSAVANSPAYQANLRKMAALLADIKKEEEQIRQGGGANAIDAQHKKGRLTARERIAKLVDSHTEFFELGLYAAYEMYEEWGGAPQPERSLV